MAFKHRYKEHISIFDVDDTLVITDSKIKVHNTLTDERFELTPEEYNIFEREQHHSLDFTDFDDVEILKAGLIVEWVLIILLKAMVKGKAVGIITARSDAKMIQEFFLYHDIDINPELIFAITHPEDKRFRGSIAERKKMAIRRFVRMGYKNIEFFDDDEKNLSLAKEVEAENPEIIIDAFLIDSQLKKIKAPNI